MKKFIPVIAVALFLLTAGYFVLNDSPKGSGEKSEILDIGNFKKTKSCAKIPNFLYKARFIRPIIDLSQTRYKGVAFYNYASKSYLHLKEWEKFGAMGTYAIDKKGNIYLVPNPYISIKKNTFNFQKSVYKIDTNSGKLEKWLTIDEIKPNALNPYGLISIDFDCKDSSLWASSIDKSSYKSEAGTIFHINPKTKKIVQKVSGFDALTLKILNSSNGKYLLAGSARKNLLYAFSIENGKLSQTPKKLLELPDPSLRIRKIKIYGKNSLILEAIKFNYSLIAQTDKKFRTIYKAVYNNKKWQIVKIE